MQVATDVRAHRRSRVENALAIAKRRNFGQAFANNGAIAGFQIIQGIKFARRQIFREVFNRGNIFLQKIADCRRRFSRWLINFLPFCIFAKINAELIRLPTTPCVMPWPESPVWT